MTDEVRDMIGKALDNEPPLGIDYGTVHAAGRRRLARRHLGIVGGTALAVIAVASTAVAVGQLNAGPANGPAGPPPATSDTPAPPATKGCVVPAMRGGYSTVPDGKATDAELAESARLTEAFAGFTLPLPPDVTTDPAKIPLCAIEASWGAEFTLHIKGAERAVFLEVLPRDGQAPGECKTFGGEVGCVVVVRPDGAVVRVSETNPRSDGTNLVNVDAWRSDGTLVRIMETGPGGPQPWLRILDDEAMITIATAPALKVNWSNGVTLPTEASDRRAAELTTILAKARVLPPHGMRPVQVPDARADALAFYVSQGGYKLDVDLVDADGTGNLFINLNPPTPHAPKLDCAGQTGCELIMVAPGRSGTLTRSQDGDIKSLQLNTVAEDGTQLTMLSRNKSGQSEDKPGATRAQPPLNTEALIRIAEIAELRW